jgi:hypothetical protein
VDVSQLEPSTDDFLRTAPPSGGKEYVKLHLNEVKSGNERTRFACKTKLFEAMP